MKMGEISGKPVNNSPANPRQLREAARKQPKNEPFQM
jgi:hypothetical protein